MKYITRTYNIGANHDIIVKRVARKLKISQNEVIRRRIKTFAQMVKELEEDMKHSEYIDLDRI